MTAVRLRAELAAAALVPVAALLAAAFVLVALYMSKAVAIALLGAVLLPALLWLSGNPRLLAIWGLMLSAPLTMGKDFKPIPHMGGAGAYSIEASDVFLAVLLVFLLRDAILWSRPLRLPKTAWFWIFAISIGALHALFGDLSHLAAQEVVQMTKGLLVFVVIVNEVVRLRLFEHVFWALAASVFLQSLIAIAQYIKKGDLGLQVLGETEGKYLELTNLATYGGAETFRIGGLLGHPNLLAGFLALTLPLLFASLSVRMGQLRKGALILILGTGGLALLLTLSRSGWLSGAFGLAVALGLGMLSSGVHLRRFASLGVMSAVGGAAAVVVAAPVIIQRFLKSDPGALDFRWEWMSVAWNMVLDSPITGIGLNTFVFRLPGNTPYGGIEGLNERFGENWPVVHNIYLIFWSELGTFGFLALVAVLLSLLIGAFMAARRTVEPMIFAILAGGGGGIAAIALDGMGSFFIRNAACGRMFWIVAGLIVAAIYWHRANEPDRRRRS